MVASDLTHIAPVMKIHNVHAMEMRYADAIMMLDADQTLGRHVV